MTIAERVKLIGGTLVIKSEPQSGTMLLVQVDSDRPETTVKNSR